MLVFAHDLAQATTDTIAHDGAADAFGSDQSHAEDRFVSGLENSEEEQPAANRAALGPDARKFTGVLESARRRKTQGRSMGVRVQLGATLARAGRFSFCV